MNEEELFHRRSEIRDRLAYLMFHAPDFPVEDRRSLASERGELFAQIARYERDHTAALTHPRFALFKMDLNAAFEAAAVGSSEVTRLFQIAAERFEETFRAPPSGPDFIAGPSGVIKS